MPAQPQLARVAFTLQQAPPDVASGQLLIVGDGQALGDWRLQHAKCMQRESNGNAWRMDIALSPGIHAFKVCVCRGVCYVAYMLIASTWYHFCTC